MRGEFHILMEKHDLSAELDDKQRSEKNLRQSSRKSSGGKTLESGVFLPGPVDEFAEK